MIGLKAQANPIVQISDMFEQATKMKLYQILMAVFIIYLLVFAFNHREELLGKSCLTISNDTGSVKKCFNTSEEANQYINKMYQKTDTKYINNVSHIQIQ
jgi:hypothetical protein